MTLPRIVAVGEALWDVLPSGPRLGGAPTNFACAAARLARGAAQVSLVTCVGDDALGRRARATLAASGVDVNHVQTSMRPTGRVDVTLDAVGTPHYTIGEDAAWDTLTWTDELASIAAASDLVCFGTLAQRHPRARETQQRFLNACPPHTRRVFDVNLRPPYDDLDVVRAGLDAADVLKLNDDELARLTPALGVPTDPEDALSRLAERFSLATVALTRGDRGALLWDGRRTVTCPGIPVDVVDTVGAGDAFTAVLALGILSGDPLDVIGARACRVAAEVCRQPGATPSAPEQPDERPPTT